MSLRTKPYDHPSHPSALTAAELAHQGPWNLFLDFDSFFAHVEKQADPALWDRPVAVSPMKTRASGVIACCYEAKRAGVRRGMRRDEAEALAPGLVFRHARHDVYIDIHHKILRGIERYIPVEKAWSVDEMSIWLGKMRLSQAVEIVQNLRAEFAKTLGPMVTASMGIAKTGLLAKIAAEMDKPDGLIVLHPDRMPAAIHHLPLGDIPGVAKGMKARLFNVGVESVPDLLALQPKQARMIWGSVEGERLWRALHGEVTTRPETKRGMFGHSRVLARDWRTPEKAAECLRILTTHAARRLRADHYFTTRLHVGGKTLPRGDYPARRVGLSRDFPAARDDFTLHRWVQATFCDLVQQSGARGFSQVSIVLMGLEHEDAINGDLFAGPRDQPKTDRAVLAMDAINARFSQNLVRIGCPDRLPGGYDGVKIAFGRIPAQADLQGSNLDPL